MKKNHLLTLGLGLLLGLLVIGYILWIPKGKTSLSSDADFAVTDTAKVNKILLYYVGKEKKSVAIKAEKKSDGTWQLNDKYPVLMPQLQYFFKTISQIKVRDKLNDAGNKNALKMIADYHVLVEIFTDKGLEKSYQIGPESKDHKGTIMKLTDTDRAYIAAIPGVQGALNPRFPTELVYWRENLLFSSTLNEVKSVTVHFHNRPDKSFEYQRDNLNSGWQLNGKPATSVENYFKWFRGKVYAESFAAAQYPNLFTRLQGETPHIVFTLKYFNGTERVVNLFDLPENKNSYIGWVKGTDDLLTIQHFVMDRFLNPNGNEMLPIEQK